MRLSTPPGYPPGAPTARAPPPGQHFYLANWGGERALEHPVFFFLRRDRTGHPGFAWFVSNVTSYVTRRSMVTANTTPGFICVPTPNSSTGIAGRRELRERAPLRLRKRASRACSPIRPAIAHDPLCTPLRTGYGFLGFGIRLAPCCWFFC